MANSNVRNIRFRKDIDEWLQANYPDNVTEGVNSIIDLVVKGELVPKPTDQPKKDKEELAIELLQVTIKIKKGIQERQDLENEYLKARKENLELKNAILHRQLDGRPLNNNRPSMEAPPVVQAIKTEIAKDTAQPKPRNTPSHVTELAPGLGLVGCDACHEVFIFDNADKGMDDFYDHLATHGRRDLSRNEINQFRNAKERIEQGRVKT